MITEMAWVEDVATKQATPLDHTVQPGQYKPYEAAREAARAAGAPSRISWHYGKGVHHARRAAGVPHFDWYEHDGKRYCFVSTR